KQGWDKIGKVIEDPNHIFLIPAKAVDGVSAASDAGEWAVEGAADAAAAATSYGEPLAVPDFLSGMVDWSMDLMFYNADGGFTVMATIFQTGMVLAEMVVGGLLILGLFTAPAAIVSFVMGVMV